MAGGHDVMRAESFIPLAVAIAACTNDPTHPTVAENVSARTAALAEPFPHVIALPTGFAPEGIAFGHSSLFYAGSATGAIWQGDAHSGSGVLLVEAQTGRSAAGLDYDPGGDRIFVAGAFTGDAYVYSASTGATLAVYHLAPDVGMINDVVLTRDAAYFTDSFRPVIYRIPLGVGGELPAAGAVQEIALTGDFEQVDNAFNANGIVAIPNDKQLIIVNTATGTLFLVDEETGDASAIDLGGASLVGGDGLVLVGERLYVVEGELNRIAVIRLSQGYARGAIERVIADAALDFPSTIAPFGRSFYVVNARFDATGYPDVDFQVVRVSR
jgi:hypothetical protein